MRQAVVALALLAPSACGGAEDPCAEPRAGSICAIAGTGDLGFNGDGRPGADTDLYAVSSVRRGPDGTIWIVDQQNHRLRVVGADGLVSTIAGNGWHGYATTGVPPLTSSLENPLEIDFLPDGAAAIVSLHEPRVLKLTDAGFEVVAGSGEVGDRGDGGSAFDAAFVELTSLAVGPDGAIYLADGGANRVRVVRGFEVFGFAGTGVAGYSGDGGQAAAAELNYPTGLAVGGDGSVYISDRLNHAVRRVAIDGTISTVAGIGAPGLAADGVLAAEAPLDEPDGVALDDRGRLYIADRNNFRVCRVDQDGRLSTVAGVGVRGFTGDGGPAVAAELAQVARLSWADGELFLADQGNSCARVVTLE